MHRGIRHFFQQKAQLKPAQSCIVAEALDEGPAADQAHTQGQEVRKPALQQFTRKRRRAEEPSSQAEAPPMPPAALPASAVSGGGAGSKPNTAARDVPAALSGHRKHPNSNGSGSGRQLTQVFLDAGQHDFHLSRCAECGLVYAKGEENDEKTHAGYHTSATKGLRYQPLPGERLVMMDGASGRVLLVPCSGDAAGRSKKLQELCTFLEEQMGLVKGWLLSVPASLYLHVSPAKRILGCVVAEGVKEAFPAVPQLGAAALEQLRSHGSAAMQASRQQPAKGHSPVASRVIAAVPMPPLARPAASMTFSSRTACTAAGATAAVTAMTSPGRQQSERGAGGQHGSSLQQVLAACSQEGRARPSAGAAEEEEEQSADSSPEQAAAAPSSARAGLGPDPAATQQQRSSSQSPQPRPQCRPSTPEEGDTCMALCSPGLQHRDTAEGQQGSGGRVTTGQQRQWNHGRGQGPAQPAAPASIAGPPTTTALAIDRSQRVRAVCGIRLVWVSMEARRRGLATRLLDCVRSHFVPGYVVPRHELAFTQPSDQGRALIEAYTSTKRFLVY